MKHLLSRTVLGLSILASASAFAADGYVTGNVYLRAGPDAGYPSVVMLNAGTPVAIEGCVNGWSWCDVDAGGNRGWVEGGYLQDDYRGQRVLVPQYGVQIGIPIISFVFATYWQDHYRNRSWYSQRQRWSQVRPQYRTIVVQHNTYGNSRALTPGSSRGTPGAYSVSHNAVPRTRAEAKKTAVVTAPARSVHEAKPSRTATPRRPVATTVQPASRANRAAPATRSVVQRAGTQPRTAAQRKVAARPKAQPKKQPAKSKKSDKNKHPDGSGQR